MERLSLDIAQETWSRTALGGHIQSLDAPIQKPDNLKPANTGILTGTLSKDLGLAQIVRSGVIMQFRFILNGACDYVCSSCHQVFNRISGHFL